jgi:hypothetical protein
LRGDDQIQDHRDLHFLGDLQGPEVLAQRHVLAERLEPFFVERFEPEEQVRQSQLLPAGKDLFVADQRIAACHDKDFGYRTPRFSFYLTSIRPFIPSVE